MRKRNVGYYAQRYGIYVALDVQSRESAAQSNRCQSSSSKLPGNLRNISDGDDSDVDQDSTGINAVLSYMMLDL